MSRKATKAASNIYYIARYEASILNPSFASREKASELLTISRTRLANIELGNIIPYPEEVLSMSSHYNCPELCNSHCSGQCTLGKKTIKKVTIDDFDRLSLKVLGSLSDIDQLRSSLISIAEDGVITSHEENDFNSILDSLNKISNNAKSLQLWAVKNLIAKK